MPRLIPTNKFLEDLENFRHNAALRKKTAKPLRFLESDPLHPGLHLERIVNDPSAWAIRVDRSIRLALDPTAHLPGGNPDWAAEVVLLRLLTHDDLYKYPRQPRPLVLDHLVSFGIFQDGHPYPLERNHLCLLQKLLSGRYLERHWRGWTLLLLLAHESFSSSFRLSLL